MKRKKAFSLVELVIVIAVVVILAAVLVPTFKNIIDRSNVGADLQLVRNLNIALAAEKKNDGVDKYETAQDAVLACARSGYLVDVIVVRYDYSVAWNKTTGDFVLIDPQTGKVVYPSENSFEEYTIGEGKNTDCARDYFLILTQMPKSGPKTAYSVYAGNGWQDTLIENLTVDFDPGYNTGIEIRQR